MTLIERLRALADWFEAHPLAPTTGSFSSTSAYVYVSDVSCFAHLGSFKKRTDDRYFYADLMVGDYPVHFMAPRGEVCTPRVVGKKLVPSIVIEARPEQVIPAHEEDIVEWDCSSVLAPKEPETVST